jgi:hypothetical protein
VRRGATVEVLVRIGRGRSSLVVAGLARCRGVA